MIPSYQLVSQKTVSTCIAYIIQEILRTHNATFMNMIRDRIAITRIHLFKLPTRCFIL